MGYDSDSEKLAQIIAQTQIQPRKKNWGNPAPLFVIQENGFKDPKRPSLG